MKDLGDLHYFLGIQVIHSAFGIFFSQQKYVTDLLHKFHVYTLKYFSTPSTSRTIVFLTNVELLAGPTEYRNMVAALQYLTMTRSDNAYVVHAASQFMDAPCTTHLHTVKRVFRYL